MEILTVAMADGMNISVISTSCKATPSQYEVGFDKSNTYFAKFDWVLKKNRVFAASIMDT